jgi:GntR family transcriptional regulator
MGNLIWLRPNISLAQQAANLLRDYIKIDFVEGGKLPGEHQLSERLGVNRGTLRQAFDILEQEGLIIRRRGAGTYANRYVINIKSRIDEAKEFQKIIHDAGYEPKTIQLALKEGQADEDIARRLRIITDTPVLISEQLLLAGEDPAIYVMDAIPLSLIKEKYDPSELKDSRFAFLLRRCHVQISYGISDILPRLCGKELSHILKIEPWQPVLQTIGTCFDTDNEPILASRVYYQVSLIQFQVRTRFVE